MQKLVLIVTFFFIILSSLGQKKSEIDSIKELCSLETVDTLKVDYFNKIGKYFYYQNFDSAYYYANKALKLSSSIHYLKGKAEAHRIIGIAYSSKGDFANSLKYLITSKEEYENNNDKKLLPFIYTSIGIVYRKKSDYNTSLEYYLKAKEIVEDLKDSVKMQAVYNNIGVIYKVIGDFDEALTYYRRSIAIAEKINNMKTAGYTYGNMAMIYREKKDFKNSVKYFDKALSVFEKQGNDVQIISVYIEKADLYFMLNDIKKSLYFLKKSDLMLDKIHNYELANQNLYIRGKILMKLKKYASARNTFYEVLRKFKKSNYIDNELKAYLSIIKLDSLTGNYKSAYLLSQQYNKIKDSVFTVNNIRSTANIQYKYDLLQKENQNIKLLKEKELNELRIRRQRLMNISVGISFLLTFCVFILFFILFRQTRRKNLLLKAKNDEIKSQNTLLEEQKERINNQFEEIRVQNEKLEKYQNHLELLVKEKTKELNKALEIAQKSDRLKTEFLENLSHEIRTPLNAVTGFTEIYNQDTDTEKINPDFIFGVQKSMDDLLHTVSRLVVISRYQVGEYDLNPEHFNLYNFFEKKKNEVLKRRAFLGKNKINIEFQFSRIDKQFYFLSDESVLDIIFTELIENAFKFTNAGTIQVNAEIKNNQLFFLVRDTGMGIKKEAIAYIFDLLRKFENGNELFRGMGVGLAIVKKATEILSGTIQVNTLPDKGTEFTIIIPELSLNSEL